MKKVYLFLTTLLFALSISAFASGTTEAAQDVLDLLRGIEQATAPSKPSPTATADLSPWAGPAWRIATGKKGARTVAATC